MPMQILHFQNCNPVFTCKDDAHGLGSILYLWFLRCLLLSAHLKLQLFSHRPIHPGTADVIVTAEAVLSVKSTYICSKLVTRYSCFNSF